jgi:hypothetical protein
MMASVKYSHTILIDYTPIYYRVPSHNATYPVFTYARLTLVIKSAANNKAVIHQCLTGTQLRQNAFRILCHWGFLLTGPRQHNLQICSTELRLSTPQAPPRLSSRSNMPSRQFVSL